MNSLKEWPTRCKRRPTQCSTKQLETSRGARGMPSKTKVVVNDQGRGDKERGATGHQRTRTCGDDWG